MGTFPTIVHGLEDIEVHLLKESHRDAFLSATPSLAVASD